MAHDPPRAVLRQCSGDIPVGEPVDVLVCEGFADEVSTRINELEAGGVPEPRRLRGVERTALPPDTGAPAAPDSARPAVPAGASPKPPPPPPPRSLLPRARGSLVSSSLQRSLIPESIGESPVWISQPPIVALDGDGEIVDDPFADLPLGDEGARAGDGGETPAGGDRRRVWKVSDAPAWLPEPLKRALRDSLRALSRSFTITSVEDAGGDRETVRICFVAGVNEVRCAWELHVTHDHLRAHATSGEPLLGYLRRSGTRPGLDSPLCVDDELLRVAMEIAVADDPAASSVAPTLPEVVLAFDEPSEAVGGAGWGPSVPPGAGGAVGGGGGSSADPLLQSVVSPTARAAEDAAAAALASPVGIREYLKLSCKLNDQKLELAAEALHEEADIDDTAAVLELDDDDVADVINLAAKAASLSGFQKNKVTRAFQVLRSRGSPAAHSPRP